MIYTNQAKNSSNCVYEYRIPGIEFVILIYQSNLNFIETQCLPQAHRESTIAKI